jgi:hypothetical protein
MKILFKITFSVKFRGIFKQVEAFPPIETDESVKKNKDSVSKKTDHLVEESKDCIKKYEIGIRSLENFDIGPLVEMFDILRGAIEGGNDFKTEADGELSPNKILKNKDNEYVGNFETMGTITIEQFIKEASKYNGVDYKLGGQGLSGIDCSGLLVAVASNLGIAKGDTTAYGFYKMSEEIETAEVKSGDAIFWKSPGGGVNHIAIITKVEADGTYTTIESTTDGKGGVQSFHRTLSPNREIRRLPFIV